MTDFVRYNQKTVLRLVRSYRSQDVIEAVQRGPLDFLWIVAAFAAEESGLEGTASCMIYVRDFETEVFFFQMEVNDRWMVRRLIYDGEEYAIKSEQNDRGEWEKFPVEGDGLTTERRQEIMSKLIEICESQITFMTPTGEPETQSNQCLCRD